MTPLSRHFCLEELVASEVAAREGIDNAPSVAELENLRRLAAFLDEVQGLLGGAPLRISSGFRCAQLNRCVGGSPRSAHMEGRAADFVVPGFGAPYQVARRLQGSALAFDQLIFEYGRWVHVAIARAGNEPRREALSIFKGGTYLAGIIEPPATLA